MGVIGAMRIPRRPDEQFVYSLEVKRDWKNQVDYETPGRPRPTSSIGLFDPRRPRSSPRRSSCRDLSRIDFRVREGIPYFIEANPLPGLAPVTSDLVILAQGHGIAYA